MEQQLPLALIHFQHRSDNLKFGKYFCRTLSILPLVSASLERNSNL